MNGQIVLCKGWNDKDELETIHDLSAFSQMQSVSIVPVGITNTEIILLLLSPFHQMMLERLLIPSIAGKASSLPIIRQDYLCGDEWYIKAGLPIPDEDSYEGYPQIENGVGMLRSFTDEFHTYLDNFSVTIEQTTVHSNRCPGLTIFK